MKRIRNIVLALFAMGLAIFVLPAVSASAEDTTDFPYVIFACDSNESVKLNANCITINGDIYTNGSVDMDAYVKNVNGQVIEQNGIDTQEMLDMFDDFYNLFFPSDSFGLIIQDDYVLSGITNINFNYNVHVQGMVDLNGNIAMDASFIADDDINFTGNVVNKNNQVLTSKYGDITLNSSNVNVNCFIYAPNGNVTINSDSVNINGIIMAKSITVNCSNLNLNYSRSVADYLSSANN